MVQLRQSHPGRQEQDGAIQLARQRHVRPELRGNMMGWVEVGLFFVISRPTCIDYDRHSMKKADLSRKIAR